MKVLLTGGKGMLGRTICRELADFEVSPTDLPDLLAVWTRRSELCPCDDETGGRDPSGAESR